MLIDLLEKTQRSSDLFLYKIDGSPSMSAAGCAVRRQAMHKELACSLMYMHFFLMFYIFVRFPGIKNQ